MREVAEWLEGLGLARYVKTFEQNEIDFDALPHLTEPMLEKIGLPLGPRAKLLAAISELLVAPSLEERSSKTQFCHRARQYAERRQITVMFCDLVNSTKLAGVLTQKTLDR